MGYEHNRVVVWVRLWAAIGAHVVSERVYAHGPSAGIARELARYEQMRYETACYALGLTAAAQEV